MPKCRRTIQQVSQWFSEPCLSELDLLRRIVASKLPFRLLAADDFNGAEDLMALGYVKVSLPVVRNGMVAYGKQEDALVSVTTPPVLVRLQVAPVRGTSLGWR